MKKIFLFAAAAMVSLSSCVQTEDVYTGGLNEIGFKSAAVRGAIEGPTFTGSMNVAAAWDADGDATEKGYVEYFAPTKFTDKEKNNVWSGEPARYWPNVGKMQFLAHFPYNGTFVVTYAGGDKIGAITGYTATVTDNEDAQDDVLYSDLHTCDCAPAAKQALTFHHAMALLQVNFKTTEGLKNEDIKIVSATVNDVVFDGKLNVTVATSTASWDETSTPTDYTFKNVDTTNKLTDTLDEDATDLLVIPTAQTSMTIVYTFNDHQMTKTVEFNKDGNNYGDWVMGKRYIYNFTIGANEILFTVSVKDWENETINGNAGITI